MGRQLDMWSAIHQNARSWWDLPFQLNECVQIAATRWYVKFDKVGGFACILQLAEVYCLEQCSSLECAHAFQCEGLLQNNHTSLKLHSDLFICNTSPKKHTWCWLCCIEYENNMMSHHFEEVHAIKGCIEIYLDSYNVFHQFTGNLIIGILINPMQIKIEATSAENCWKRNAPK